MANRVFMLSSVDDATHLRFIFDQVRLHAALLKRGVDPFSVNIYYNLHKTVDIVAAFAQSLEQSELVIPLLTAENVKRHFRDMKKSNSPEKDFIRDVSDLGKHTPVALKNVLLTLFNHGSSSGKFGRAGDALSGEQLRDAVAAFLPTVNVCIVLVACFGRTLLAPLLALDLPNVVVIYDSSIPNGLSLNWLTSLDTASIVPGSFLMHSIWPGLQYGRKMIEEVTEKAGKRVVGQGIREGEYFQLVVGGRVGLLDQPFFGTGSIEAIAYSLPRFRFHAGNPGAAAASSANDQISAALAERLAGFLEAQGVRYAEFLAIAFDPKTEEEVDRDPRGYEHATAVASKLEEAGLIDADSNGSGVPFALTKLELDRQFIEYLRS